MLVCDDERHIVRLIQVNLERQGWRVSTAFDGVEALASMRRDRPDLVILDDDMPRLSGPEVLRAMRQDPGSRDIPVIEMGKRRDDDDDGRPTPPGGPVAFLTKPFKAWDVDRAFRGLL